MDCPLPLKKQGYFSLLEGAKGETACLSEGSLHFELFTRHNYVLFNKADLQNKRIFSLHITILIKQYIPSYTVSAQLPPLHKSSLNLFQIHSKRQLCRMEIICLPSHQRILFLGALPCFHGFWRALILSLKGKLTLGGPEHDLLIQTESV